MHAVGIMTGCAASDAAWCRANLGKAFGDLPARPADNRCELCKRIYNKKLRCDFDRELEHLGTACRDSHFRGWVCAGCHGLLNWLHQIGRKTLFAYLDRDIPLGDDPPEYPADDRCQLCMASCGAELVRDHCHRLEAKGCNLSLSQRGYVCQACNTGRLARIDEIGIQKFRRYIDSARKNVTSAPGILKKRHRLKRELFASNQRVPLQLFAAM